jgi:hypothetical protein
MLSKFFSTQNVSKDGQSLWSPNSKLWPTILALVVASCIFVLTSGILIAYARGKSAVDKMAAHRVEFDKLVSFFTICMTITMAVGLKATSSFSEIDSGGSRSLWSQVCSPTTEHVTLFSQEISFNVYCGLQVSSFNMLISDLGVCVCAYSHCCQCFEFRDLCCQLVER